MKLRQILKRSLGVCFDFDGSKFVSCLSSGDLLLVKYFIHKLSRCEFIYPTVKVSKGRFSKSWGLRASVSFSPSPLLPSVLRSPQFLCCQKAKNTSRKNLLKGLLRRLSLSSFVLMCNHIAASTRLLISMVLVDLQEAAQCKMAWMYMDVCESDEFLSNVNADQLSSLLSRDDLIAPSENFVFKSVMQWIEYKKKERMEVAGKVIGAVRLGLVDIKDVIIELNTEEMKQVPEIDMLLKESLLYSHIPSSSTFGEEKSKQRSSGPVRNIYKYLSF